MGLRDLNLDGWSGYKRPIEEWAYPKCLKSLARPILILFNVAEIEIEIEIEINHFTNLSNSTI